MENNDRSQWVARHGTFDESVFVNPKNGKFSFPKYKSPRASCVPIVDVTDYKESFWDDLEPSEKREYNLRAFEYSVSPFSLEFEIAPLEQAFDALVEKERVGLELKGFGGEVVEFKDDLKHFLEDQDPAIPHQCYLLESEFLKCMLRAGFFDDAEKSCTSQELQALKSLSLSLLSVKELKEVCTKNGVTTSGNKEDLVGKLEKATISMPIIPIGKFDAQAFERFYDSICTCYVQELRATIDRWHPVYIAAIWENVGDLSEDVTLKYKVDQVIESKYWEQRLL